MGSVVWPVLFGLDDDLFFFELIGIDVLALTVYTAATALYHRRPPLAASAVLEVLVWRGSD